MATKYEDFVSQTQRLTRHGATASLRFAAVLLTSISCALAAPVLSPPDGSSGPKNLRPQQLAVPIDEASLQLQYATLAAMALNSVEYNQNNLVRFIRGHTGLKLSNHKNLKAGDVTGDLTKKLMPVLLTTGTEIFTVRQNMVSEDLGRRNIQLTQSIANLPVIPGLLSVSVNEDTGEIVELSSSVIPDRGLTRKPKITAEKAKQLAATYLEGAGWAETKSAFVSGEPELAYFAGTTEARKPALVWSMKIDFLTADHPPPARPGGSPVRWQVFIDAVDGAYLGQLSVTNDAPRSVYSANNSRNAIAQFPNGLTFLFGEGQSHSDQIAMRAYENTGKAQSAWSTSLQDSISYPLGIVVHWGAGNEAQSGLGNGGKWWMAFQDGNSTYIPQADSLDTVAHEFGHGILHKYNGLAAGVNEEWGSINEAWADFSAVVVDAQQRPPTFEPVGQTWELHEIFKTNPAQAVTSWMSPKSRGQWWADYYPKRLIGITADVHYNSTIMGLAYRLLVTGGTHPRAGQNGIPATLLTGIGHTQAKRIFWTALNNDQRLKQHATFQDAKAATVAFASTLYGQTAAARTSAAWEAVGVTSCANKSPPARPSGTLEDLLCAGRYRLTWPDVLGATTYHAERVMAGYPWSLATTIVDGDVNSCSGQAGQTTRFRMRACNECGCSDYQDLGTVQFWSPCP